MFSNLIEILVLSFVQGISEFLPISSSAHLLIISKLKTFQSSSLEIDISLHLGSLLAIIFYFRKDLSGILKNKDLSLLMILGSIPLIVVGFILHKTGFINYLRNIEVIAWTTLLFGILLFFSDKFEIKKNLNNDLNIRNILIISCFQILALIPGVSRSGVVITAGRFLKFDRYESSKISFYLSIPAIAGASFLGLKDISSQNIEINFLVFISVFLSFIFSYLTVKYFLIFVKNFSLNTFVFYRIILALILFYIIYF